jgi:hypothetical protein
MNQKEQSKILLNKHGLPANDKYTGTQIVALLRLEMKEQLDAHLKKLDKFIKKEYGRRCKEYDKDCVVCQAYDLVDEAKGIVKKNK